MTFRKYTYCIVIVVYFVLLIHVQSRVSNEALNVHVYERAFRSIEANATDAVFVSKRIVNVEECVRACEMTTTCRFVNYRVRGHLCSLTNYIGELNVTVRKDPIPGFVSWLKPNMLTSEDDTDVCPGCNSTASCERNDILDTCEIVACGRPNTYGQIAVSGNMYNVGDRLAFICYNQTTDAYDPRTIVCTKEGHWEGGQNVCGDIYYSLTNGTNLMFKVIDLRVNKGQAMENCQRYGATLTTMLSVEKQDIFRTLLSDRSGQYWVNTERQNGVWRTSDGREQPMDEALWRVQARNRNNHNCARVRPDLAWRLDDIKCQKRFAYICEFV